MDNAKLIRRCLYLAEKGKGRVAPNPMVGAVIVHEDKVIGEGYHEFYGGPHAEVNAIKSVKDKSLLSSSTIYVNLEPCAHYGKTPPCADLIIKHGFQKVVIGALDPFSEVNGRGIQKLKEAGIEVEVGVLEKESVQLNKRFYLFNNNKRPFILLKWAETKNGFMGRCKEDGPTWISGKDAKCYSHQLRANEAAILVGTNTAIEDNPSLTTRLVNGTDPLRIVLDRSKRLGKDMQLFSDANFLVLGSEDHFAKNLKVMDNWENWIEELMEYCYLNKIQSIIIEGGANVLNQFIEKDIWDEIHQIVSKKVVWRNGISSPRLALEPNSTISLMDDNILIYTR